jgi:WD40 repeat protein
VLAGEISFAQQRVIKAPPTTFGCLAISPDGATLASGNSREPDPAAGGLISVEIRLWDVASGNLLRSIKAHPNGVACLAFSPDGKTLASGGWIGDPKVRIWDTSSGKLLQELGDSKSAVCFVAFAPDGRALVSCMDKIAVWNLATAMLKWQARPTSPVDSIAISPDGRLLASGNGAGTVSLWDFESGKIVRTLPAQQVIATGSQAVMFAPDGKTLATGGFLDGKVRIWDVQTGQMIRKFGTKEGMVMCLAFAPDGKSIATEEGGEVRLWEVSTGKQLRKWASGSVRRLAFTPDGKTLAWYFGRQIALQPVDHD